MEITAALIDRATLLARTHALRGYDAVQLAAALAVQGLVPTLMLVSADAELNAAAIREGMSIEIPNLHP